MASGSYSMLKCVNFGGCYMPPEFEKIKETIANMEVRDDAVFVTSLPKSGTTWCQEMVYLLSTDLNYEGAKIDLDVRCLQLEGSGIRESMCNYLRENNAEQALQEVLLGTMNLENLKTDVSQNRFFKTHLPFHLLPKQIICGEKQPKVIHIMRNPKQVAASAYPFFTIFWPVFKGSLEDFIDVYTQGKAPYGNYFNTVLSYWNERHRSNVLILTYEEMCKDLRGSIGKVAKFLGKSYDEEQVKELEDHLSFNKMKQNDSVNKNRLAGEKGIHFMRKGKVDSYKEELTPELIQKLDRWISENIKGTGLPYEGL